MEGDLRAALIRVGVSQLQQIISVARAEEFLPFGDRIGGHFLGYCKRD